MHSDRTVYAPEMDEEGNGVVRAASHRHVNKNRVNSSRSILCCLLIPFFFFFSIPLFIHSTPTYAHTYASNLEQIFPFYDISRRSIYFGNLCCLSLILPGIRIPLLISIFEIPKFIYFFFFSKHRSSSIFSRFSFDHPLILILLLQPDSIQYDTIKANHLNFVGIKFFCYTRERNVYPLYF